MFRKTSISTDKPEKKKIGRIYTRVDEDEESVRNMARRGMDLIAEEGVEGYERVMQLKLEREFREMCRIGKKTGTVHVHPPSALEGSDRYHSSESRWSDHPSSSLESVCTTADNAGQYDSMEAMGYEMDYLEDPILGRAVARTKCSDTCGCYGTDGEVNAANERIRQGLGDAHDEFATDDCRCVSANGPYTNMPYTNGGFLQDACPIESYYEPALVQMGVHPVDSYNVCNPIPMQHYFTSEWPMQGPNDPIIDTNFDRYKKNSLRYQESPTHDAHIWPFVLDTGALGPIARLLRRAGTSEGEGQTYSQHEMEQQRNDQV